jgi:hypothetical protein
VNATIPATFRDAVEHLQKHSDILALHREPALLEKDLVLDVFI